MTDPVCGMEVDENKAAATSYDVGKRLRRIAPPESEISRYGDGRGRRVDHGRRGRQR